VDIRPIVLGKRRQPTAPARSRLVPAVIGLLLLAVGVGVGLFLLARTPSAPPRQAAELAPASLPTVQVTTTQPTQPVAVPPTPARPEPLPAAPATPAAKTPARPRPPVAEQPAAAGEQAEIALTISGIAWQEERALRRAVVNGALVAEGAEVAGARVVEIRERSVRFARDGRTFDIGYSSPFPR
jgi:general secretion pathway protein B